MVTKAKSPVLMVKNHVILQCTKLITNVPADLVFSSKYQHILTKSRSQNIKNKSLEDFGWRLSQVTGVLVVNHVLNLLFPFFVVLSSTANHFVLAQLRP